MITSRKANKSQNNEELQGLQGQMHDTVSQPVFCKATGCIHSVCDDIHKCRPFSCVEIQITGHWGLLSLSFHRLPLPPLRVPSWNSRRPLNEIPPPWYRSGEWMDWLKTRET